MVGEREEMGAKVETNDTVYREMERRERDCAIFSHNGSLVFK